MNETPVLMSESVAQMAVAEVGLSVEEWVGRVMLEGCCCNCATKWIARRHQRWYSGDASATRCLHRLYAVAGPVKAVGHAEQASSCARSSQGL